MRKKERSRVEKVRKKGRKVRFQRIEVWRPLKSQRMPKQGMTEP